MFIQLCDLTLNENELVREDLVEQYVQILSDPKYMSQTYSAIENDPDMFMACVIDVVVIVKFLKTEIEYQIDNLYCAGHFPAMFLALKRTKSENFYVNVNVVGVTSDIMTASKSAEVDALYEKYKNTRAEDHLIFKEKTGDSR